MFCFFGFRVVRTVITSLVFRIKEVKTMFTLCFILKRRFWIFCSDSLGRFIWMFGKFTFFRLFRRLLFFILVFSFFGFAGIERVSLGYG